MKVLRTYLEITGITQAELAKRAGLSHEEVSLYVNGKREPRAAKLRALSRATGISVERLIDSIEEQA